MIFLVNLKQEIKNILKFLSVYLQVQERRENPVFISEITKYMKNNTHGIKHVQDICLSNRVFPNEIL